MNIDISFEDAIKDSPVFRQKICSFFECLDAYSKWLEMFSVCMKQYIGSKTQLNDIVSKTKKLTELNDSPVFQTFCDALSTIGQIRSKLVESLEVGIIALVSKIQDEVARIKRMNRNWEKLMEKHESAFLRYSSVLKIKDMGTMQEEAYILFETKKQYIKASLDLVQSLIGFKFMIEQLLQYQLLVTLDDQMCYHEQSSEVLESFQPAVKLIESKISDAKEASKDISEKLDKAREVIEEEALKAYKPSEEDFLDYDLLCFDSPGSLKNANTQKEGYLIRKRLNQLNGWSRRYCTINENYFSYYAENMKQISFRAKIEELSYRKSTLEDKRYCFEIEACGEIVVLQALTLSDFKSWLNALAACKRRPETGIIQQQEVPDIVVENPEISNSPIPEFTFMYSDPIAGIGKLILENRNYELHQVFKSIPTTDYVMDVHSVALQKDIAVQGRIFLTQNRLCFYSNILGFVNQAVVLLSQVSGVGIQKGTFTSSISITMDNGTVHVLHAYSKGEKIVSEIQFLKKQIDLSPPEIWAKFSELFVERSETMKKSPSNSSQNENPKKSRSSKLSSEIPSPEPPIECNCQEHLDQIAFDQVLDIPAKELFEMLFGSNSKQTWSMIDEERGGSNRLEGEWKAQQRDVEYNIKVSNPMIKLDQLNVKETDQILRMDENALYIVEMRTKTPQVPMGDCFNTVTRICISFNSHTSCRVIHSVGVLFVKSTMMKSIIKSNAIKGLSDTAKIIQRVIKQNITGVKESTQEQSASAETLIPKSDQGLDFQRPVTILSIFIALIIVVLVLFRWKPVNDEDWKLSLKTKNSRGMKLFLSNWNHLSFNNSQLHQIHQELVLEREFVFQKRQTVAHLSDKLNELDRQIMWSQYYNWIEDTVERGEKLDDFS